MITAARTLAPVCILAVAMCSFAQQPVTTNGGSVNVVPKYSGTATIVKSAIYESGGNVGIGTTSPSAALYVNGSLTSTGISILGDTFRFYSGAKDGNTTFADFRTNPSNGNSVLNAKSGILYLNFDHGAGGVQFGNGAGAAVATISALGNATFSGTGNSSFGGNLGIGIASPSSKLTVAGVVQSTTGGFKFPDNTVQTTAAAPGGLTSVSHNNTLTGAGTSKSPLGVAAPLVLTAAVPSYSYALTVLSAGSAVGAFGGGSTGSNGGAGVGGALYGGNGDDFNGGASGVIATGGSGGLFAGYGGEFHGGVGNGPTAGGSGIFAAGGEGGATGGYGIYTYGGVSSDGSFADAGLFEGDVYVNGSISKAGGSFKIDHPLDPANKYLSHSFVESPDMKNIYDGNVITDATGTSTVTLPDWFESLNRDFRYQLTVIGQFAQAIIASKIAGNQFTIRTDKPNVEVSWQVTGIRQDVWANAHRIPVEQEKPAREQGYYLHPELYNQPRERFMVYAEHPDLMRKPLQRPSPR